MKQLIIIGANNFQLPLIKKAKEMGLETHVFAWEDGAVAKNIADYFYPISITEKEEIFSLARKIKPQGIISIASDQAMHTVNYIAGKMGLVGNSMQSTLHTTNKYLMRKKLSENGLPCPDFSKVDKTKKVTDKSIHYPVIVKPTDRSGSRGVSRVENENELKVAINRALEESFNKEVIVEEFISGREFSIEMISWHGEHHFLQITEKETSGPPYFVEKAQHQPAQLPDQIRLLVIEQVKKSLTVLGVENGASHSEVIINANDEIFITEIGARMGGDYIGSDLVQLSTGFDFLKETINISLGSFGGIQLKENNFAGVYYSLPKPGNVKEIIDNSGKFPEIVRSEVYVKPNDQIYEIKESNQRPACFIYQSKNNKFTPDSEIIKIITS